MHGQQRRNAGGIFAPNLTQYGQPGMAFDHCCNCTVSRLDICSSDQSDSSILVTRHRNSGFLASSSFLGHLLRFKNAFSALQAQYFRYRHCAISLEKLSRVPGPIPWQCCEHFENAPNIEILPHAPRATVCLSDEPEAVASFRHDREGRNRRLPAVFLCLGQFHPWGGLVAKFVLCVHPSSPHKH